MHTDTHEHEYEYMYLQSHTLTTRIRMMQVKLEERVHRVRAEEGIMYSARENLPGNTKYWQYYQDTQKKNPQGQN